MNINDFLSEINDKGFSKVENFQILVSKPSGNVSIEKDMMMRIETAEIPGRNINSIESLTYGLPYQMASTVNYNDFTCTIIMSEDLSEKNYIEEWQDKIVGDFRKTDSIRNNINIKYYKTYVGKVTVIIYNEIDEIVYEVDLIDAWPMTVGALNTSWAGSTEIHKLQVTFKYRYYKVKKV